MRKSPMQPPGRWILGLVCAFVLASTAGGARAVPFLLNVELDTGATDSWGVVEVSETAAGSLLFEIHLYDALGPGADLHRFYFNLAGDAVATDVITLDAVRTDYKLRSNPPVNGGAGIDFDYAVSFGNGAGRKGNGILRDAHFEILGHDLDLVALTSSFSTSASGIAAFFAVHVQGTETYLGADSETVVAMVPEPGTALLLALGLIALALRLR